MTDQAKPELKRARNSGHQPLNNLIREDWRRLVERHPDSFDVLVYVPTGAAGTTDPEWEGETEALFGTVDRHQNAISYDLPVVVSAMVATMDDPLFSGMWDTGEHLGAGDGDTLSMLLSVGPAPVGAIVEFEEEQADGTNRRVWWYVHNVEVIGTAAVGALHTCIPCGDLEAGQRMAAEMSMEEAQFG